MVDTLTPNDQDADKKYAPKVGSQDDLPPDQRPDAKQVADLERSFASDSAPEPSYGKSANVSTLRNGEDTNDDMVGLGYTGKNKQNLTKKPSRFSLNKKKVGIAGGITGVIVGGGIFGLSIVQGPLQFIHAGQLLQGFHLQKNEDFGDSRGSRVILYALMGKGAERTRLGIVGNKVADKMEAKLVKDAGIRPVYSSTTRRFVGWQITDANKMNDKLGSTTNAFGDGAQIKKVDSATIARQNLVTSRDGKLPGNADFVDARDLNPRQRRVLIRAASKATDTRRLASTVASRLLIKRGGVDFSPLKNLQRASTDKLADWRQKRIEDRATRNREGVRDGGVTTDPGTDKNNNPNATPEDKQAADSTTDAIDKAKANPGKDTIKRLVKNSTKGAVALGVLCAAKSFGQDVDSYKYTNNALPMLRAGMGVVTMGNQVMSGQRVNLDELGAYNEQFYDAASKTSFFDATSIRTNLGESTAGSVDLPKEAQLNNINDKPVFFDILDSIPGLGTSCNALTGIGNLPVLKQISQGVAALAQGAVDKILQAFGTSIETVVQGALAMVSGQSVDLLSRGGEFGAIADTGAFLAANDSAMSMGGTTMNSQQAFLLRSDELDTQKREMNTKSFASRYFDPYNYASLTGNLIDHTPSSFGQLAAVFTSPLQNVSSVIGGLFNSRARAAATYDYGVPTFGFTLAEQEDPRFDNPYDNANYVESKLDALNSKYGKCFGMTATATTSGVQLISASYTDSGEPLNQFKIAKMSECHDGSEDLLRYRFYLADAIAESSLGCSELDDSQSCSNVGFAEQTGTNTQTGSPVSPSGSAQELATQLLKQWNKNLTGNPGVFADLTATSQGKSINNSDTCGNTVTLDAGLLQVLLTTTTKYKLFLFNIVTGHGCDQFFHPKGMATDIGSITDLVTGQTSDFSGAAPALDRSFLTYLASLLPKDAGLGQSQCAGRAGTPMPPGIVFFEDGCNHQHLQMKTNG